MRNLILLMLLFFVASAGVEAQGVIFEDLGYDDVVKKAKEENKLIFIDVFAKWCMPCRKMDEVVFPDPNLGSYMNKHFVSYKADAQFNSGKMLARKYGVDSYPHYLFVDTKGNLIYKSKGYMSPEKLISEAQVAANPGVYNKYKLLKKKFNSGSRDKYVLQELLNVSYNRYKKTDEAVFEVYYKQLDLMDKQNEDVLITVGRFVPEAEGGAYDLAKNYYFRIAKDTSHKYRRDIDRNLYAAIDNSLTVDCKEKNDDELESVLTRMEEMLFFDHPSDTLENIKRIEMARIRFYDCAENSEAFGQGTQDYVGAFLWDDERFHKDTTVTKSIAQVAQDMEDASRLAEFADKYLDYFTDSDNLFLAKDWIEQAIRWDDQLSYHATRALISNAMGDKSEGVNIARRALERARKENSDYASTLEDVLFQIVDGKSLNKSHK
jgi:thioredoxin-related protein